LVAGLNAGGRGYYALDVTDPTNPKGLWELTPAIDADVGYSFGKPLAVKLASGTWVILVTSGYNNVGPGTGGGFLYVLNPMTGAIISKIATLAGSATTPSGLAQVSASATSPSFDATALYVYGGDLLGNVWRFDLNSGVAATGTGSVMKMAVLTGPTGAAQPVTTRPLIATVSGVTVVYVGTGKYLEQADLTTTQTQSLYAIKDDGTLLPAFTTGTNRTSGNLVEQVIVDSGATRKIPAPLPVSFATTRGWYIDFPDTGERLNIDMILVQSTLLVATNIPDSATACTSGGRSWLNYFDYASGGPLDTTNVVGQQFANDMITGLNIVWPDSKTWEVVPDLTGHGPTKPPIPPPSPPGLTGTIQGHHVSWRELIQ
jgi:type IV pilus assembly protein PilY1